MILDRLKEILLYLVTVIGQLHLDWFFSIMCLFMAIKVEKSYFL